MIFRSDSTPPFKELYFGEDFVDQKYVFFIFPMLKKKTKKEKNLDKKATFSGFYRTMNI